MVFEIGTLSGYTAPHFALNTDDQSKIYTLDLRPHVRPALTTTLVDDRHIQHHSGSRRYAFEGSPVAGKIQCLFGDNATFDYTSFHDVVDLFFIDSAHSYESVNADTLNALRCCRSGGVIAWYDFGCVAVNGVSRWLAELSTTRRIYAVPRGSLAYTVVE